MYYTKFKIFPYENINVAQIMILVFDRRENIGGKGENDGYHHFLLFRKASSPQLLKVMIVGYRDIQDLSWVHGWDKILLTHYQTTNFRLFQTKKVCRRQFQIWQKWQKVIQTGRKRCGKRWNCSLWAFSPFPTVFSKGLFPRGVKRCRCVGMG